MKKQKHKITHPFGQHKSTLEEKEAKSNLREQKQST